MTYVFQMFFSWIPRSVLCCARFRGPQSQEKYSQFQIWCLDDRVQHFFRSYDLGTADASLPQSPATAETQGGPGGRVPFGTIHRKILSESRLCRLRMSSGYLGHQN